MTTRTGVHLSQQLPTPDIVEVATFAEHLGYERFFFSDHLTRDPFVVLTACARETERISLGTAVMPLYERHPLNAAVASASLAHVSDDRFRFGIGTSHREMVEGQLGIPWRRPVTHLLEYIAIIRALHTGEAVHHNGEFYQINAKLPFPPGAPVPIYLGPSGPILFEHAGAIADGVVLNWGPPDFLAGRLRLLEKGRDNAGRSADSVEIACSLWCAVTAGPDETQRMRADFRIRTGFFAQMAIYRQRFGELGFAQEMAAVEAALDADQPVGPHISEALVDAISIIGDADYCRARLDTYRDAGVALPLVVPLTSDDGDLRPIRRTLEALAP
jgi:alkanesulfonate monooxygenase SsuD/methylene tetrahydromethanopterin reductase-like flavin-dependent oxidoreductase (luciferase family)